MAEQYVVTEDTTLEWFLLFVVGLAYLVALVILLLCTIVRKIMHIA